MFAQFLLELQPLLLRIFITTLKQVFKHTSNTVHFPISDYHNNHLQYGELFQKAKRVYGGSRTSRTTSIFGHTISVDIRGPLHRQAHPGRDDRGDVRLRRAAHGRRPAGGGQGTDDSRHRDLDASRERIIIQMLKESILSHIKLAHGFIICDFPPDVETGKLFEKEVCKPTRILFLRGSIQTMKKRALNKIRTQKLLQILQEKFGAELLEKEDTKAALSWLARSPHATSRPRSPRKQPKQADIDSKMATLKPTPSKTVVIEHSSKAPKRIMAPEKQTRKQADIDSKMATLKPTPSKTVVIEHSSKAPKRINAPEKQTRKQADIDSKMTTLKPTPSKTAVIEHASKAPKRINAPEKAKTSLKHTVQKKSKQLETNKPSETVTELERKTKMRRSTKKSLKQMSSTLTIGERVTNKSASRPASKDADTQKVSKSLKRVSKPSQTNSGWSSVGGSRSELAKRKRSSRPTQKSRSSSSLTKRSMAEKGRRNPSKTSNVSQKSKPARSKDLKGSADETPPLPQAKKKSAPGRRKAPAAAAAKKRSASAGEQGATTFSEHLQPLVRKRLDEPSSKQGSGLRMPRKVTIRSESKTMPEIYKQIFSIKDLPEEDRPRVLAAGDAFDEQWEQKVQNFYLTNADILMHFGNDITQINAERQPVAVFESLKRTLNEICVAKGLTKLIVPLDHLKSGIL